MNNTKLIFKHEIPIEVFAECNTTVELLINNEICFKKEYKANTIHKEVIELNHEYNGSKKNTMSFLFSGEREVEKKYLKISHVIIHKQTMNIVNAEYFPDINQEWWEQITPAEKDGHNETIYGKTGSVFGWYGEINFYYCCGFDLRDKFRYNIENNDNTRLLDERLNWIFLDENSIKKHNTLND